MARRNLIKLILLGDSSVGKTSLISQYVTHKFSTSYKVTIGADFSSKDITLGDGRQITLQIWDTAGQERFQSLGVAFYRGADACMVTFDLTDQASFDHLNNWLEEFREHTGLEQSEPFPFIILGNKADLTSKRVVSDELIRTWLRANGNLSYFETSAKDGRQVEEAFQAVAQQALERAQEKQQIFLPESLELASRQKQQKSTCCG